MQSVPTGCSSTNFITPFGIRPCACKSDIFLETTVSCEAHATPTIYSSLPLVTDTTNRGGLGHCLSLCIMAHLSGSIPYYTYTVKYISMRQLRECDIVIIGGGVLGVSTSYFLAYLNPDANIVVVEREKGVAYHASGRNTGKVHAPYRYDPHKNRLSAKSALLGYGMWEKYADVKELPFRKDGVMEVALNDEQIHTLERYQKWGLQNGLDDDDMQMVDGASLRRDEPNVQCTAALVCSRDASVDYRAFTESLAGDAISCGVQFLYGRQSSIKTKDGHNIVTLDDATQLRAKFLINTGGGQSVDIAHSMNLGQKYTDMHFRGEYWQAPNIYRTLTSKSVYSVPQNIQYPFLDPHWILRHDGTCEVGPNAVPVFDPYGYDIQENISHVLPKMREMLESGAYKILFDNQFRNLVINEAWSSMSKNAMINRVKKFIPALDARLFKRRGTAGIRSNIIDTNGHFVSGPIILYGDNSLHILNYNSPGATGALPFAVHLITDMNEQGIYHNTQQDATCGPWRFSDIII